MKLPPRPEPRRAIPVAPAIDWEQFMGVKLFAWLGGFALFLGVVFFVKYSFDNNLISPQMRVTEGRIDGTAAEIHRGDSFRSNLIRNNGNELFLLVSPHPLEAGREYERRLASEAAGKP